MRTKPPRLSAEARKRQALDLRTYYDAGATVSELQERTGLSHGTVVSRLRAAGTTMRTPSETRQLRSDVGQVEARRRLAALLRIRYESGLKVDALAAECGRSARTVRRLLIEAGTVMRSPRETRQLQQSAARQSAARQQPMVELMSRYDEGEKVSVLAIEYGCSDSTVYRLPREAGAAKRLRHRPPSRTPGPSP
ncbi:helix-turn-helix domain containing protein [Streptomyces sp. BHT-5-2]|uniref:helix-turn-helix domain-containing protein n=1 Tax=Streptomyces sp. BHT-5-2 TaxID=2866715 RepID=UPI001C8E69C4|nr:helix-turn-helix domain-containing protein [Streptomyces sp. BHT-5-2]QZL06384.1 helix-turn-helix domain containing protein [Streptomyces sp. BHT-5-2]